MSAPAEPTKGAAPTGAESPTTARPLEMDDDDVQETGVLGEDGTPITSTTVPAPAPDSEETAPPKPPRPLTEAQKNQQILKEAFPGVDDGVIKAILSASGSRVEPAFNALLEMTDPEAAKKEDVPPPQPPRRQPGAQMSQLEADEAYARRLAQQYDNVGAYEARTSNSRGGPGLNEDDREPNFFDDELPVIRENLRKGFVDTQTKVSGWITTLRKRIEDNFDESDENAQQPGQPGRSGGSNRRSGDYERYDADPEVIGDDFSGMRLSSDGHPGRTSSNLRMHSDAARPGDGRRVNFKEDHEEINMYDTSPKVPPKDTPPKAGAKASKWQPLSTVDPNPIADNDPFSLGDSEDEKDAKDKPKDTKDTKDTQDTQPDTSDENERLKQAAAEAMADSLVDPAKEGDESAEKKS